MLKGDVEIFDVDNQGEVITSTALEPGDSNNEENKPPKIIPNGDNKIDIDLSLLTGGEDPNIGDEENEDEPVVNKSKDTTTPPSKHGGNSSSTLNLQTLTSAMQEGGYLAHATEEEIKGLKTATDFANLIEKEIKANELNDLPDDAIKAVQALRNGAKWEDIVAFKKQEAINNQYTEESLKGDDKIEDRKALITQYFQRTTQFTPERIAALVKRSIDTGADEVDAIEYLKELKEMDKGALDAFNAQQAKKAEDAKEAQIKRVNTLKETINKTDEFIPGIKMNKKQKDSLFKSMVEPTGKAANGAPVNNFIHQYNTSADFRIKVHALSVLTNNFESFETLKAKAKKSALSKLDEELARGQSGGRVDDNTYSLEEGGEIISEGLSNILKSY